MHLLIRRNPSVAIGVATFAYFVAVTQRSSLGAVSNQAIDRFSVLAVELSTLAIVQLLAYASMQIPAGFIIDRFGVRNSMTFGLSLIGVGQVLVAIAEVYWLAATGRLLLGVGDAFIFISLVRLIQSSLSGRRGATVQQLLTNIGQLGQVASAIPFAWFLGTAGWSSAFLGLGAMALATAALLFLALESKPKGFTHKPQSGMLENLRETVRDTAARSAFWTHFTLQSSGSTFVLLWGRTYLEHVHAVSDFVAGLILSSFVLFAFVLGPAIARLSTRSLLWQRRVVSAIATWVVLGWLFSELLSPEWGVMSIWIVMPALAAGGAGSMIAFQITQSHCPASRLGLANGFANIGGFFATLLMMGLVGAVLDVIFALGLSQERYSANSLQFAMCAQLIVVVLGFWRFRKNHASLTV